MHTLLPSRTVRLVTIAVVSFEIATTRSVRNKQATCFCVVYTK